MKHLQVIEPIRFFLHWCILLVATLSGFWVGWEAGIALGALIAGIVHFVVCALEILLPKNARQKVIQYLEPITQNKILARLKHVARGQFICIVCICMLSLVLALVDPLFSRMFFATIFLGSALMVGCASSVVLFLLAIIAAIQGRKRY